MKIIPCNRHVLVQPIDESDSDAESTSGILLPEDFKAVPKFSLAKVVSKSTDCSVDVNIGERIVYNTSMLEEVPINNGTYYLLLENYITCVVSQ